VAHSRRYAARPGGALASPRFRRRAGLVFAALLVAGAFAAALVIGNTAAPPLPLTNRPPILGEKPKPARLTAADRKTILAVSQLFVLTAVRRDHPERAWPLASPALRRGTTLADWKAGTLPFAPYPVSNARWNLAYSDVGEVGLDVLVESKDPQIRPLIHRLTLVPSKRSTGPAWLVDGWTPMSLSPGGFVASPFPASSAVDIPRSTPPPSRYWILAPFAVLAAALLIPIVMAARSRRAERRFRRRWRV
jgi:hypothetical protein